MKVSYTRDFNEEELKALAYHYGDKKKSTREDVKTWIGSLVEGALDDITSEYDNKDQ